MDMSDRAMATREHLMGERTKEALRVHFDARVRLEFHGATLTSDGGLLACRELDDALIDRKRNPLPARA